MPPSNDEIRAAIGAADHALGRTYAAEGQAPAHVNPVPATPAAQGFTDDDVASWSKQLGFAPKATTGRVTNAKD
jgi:hypothetical protein